MAEFKPKIVKFKCVSCGHQLGVAVYRKHCNLLAMDGLLWWKRVKECPKCHYEYEQAWLSSMFRNELDEADNLPM